MSKVAFCADVHVGNHKVFGGRMSCGANDRCRRTLTTLLDAVDRATEMDCDHFVILGDLFDGTTPKPQVISEVQAILVSEYMKVWVLLGNHEQVSDADGDHALGPLHRFDESVTVIDKTTVIPTGGSSTMVLVPFKPGPASLWLPGEIGSAHLSPGNKAHTCLGLHLGLADGKEAKFLANSDDSINQRTLAKVCMEHGIDQVMAGNWHWWNRRRVDTVWMNQVGTLCPTGFDNPGYDGHGSLVFWDSDSGKVRREQIAGPRFVTWRSLTEGRKGRVKAEGELATGNSIHIRWHVGRDEVDTARELAEEWGLAGVSVLPGAVDTKAAARGAALAARSADTLNDALSGFIDNMELPKGVKRVEVKKRCRKYLEVK